MYCTNLKLCLFDFWGLFVCLFDVSTGVVTLGKFKHNFAEQKSSIVHYYCSDAWSTTHSEVIFKPNSFLFVNMAISLYQLEHNAKSVWGNLIPYGNIPNYVDSFWNDWISPVKICWTTVSVRTPLIGVKVICFVSVIFWDCCGTMQEDGEGGLSKQVMMGKIDVTLQTVYYCCSLWLAVL